MSSAPTAVEVRPTYADIDLAALAHNLKQVQTHVGQARVLAVVKADAYGHGAARASEALLEAGAWGLAVSLVEEGVELREAGVRGPIVVLGGAIQNAQDVIVHRQLTPVVWSTAHLDLLSAAVRSAGAHPVRVHVKIDTGMSRLGLLPDELPALLEWLVRDAGASVVLEGVMTHFACADGLEDDLTSLQQLATFERCLVAFAERGLRPSFRHTCNSAAIVRFPQAHFDMVRPGIALYGGASTQDVQLDGVEVAMSVRSKVLAIRTLPAGVRVSYGGRATLTRASQLAIVPVGYADGYPRNMSGKAQMLVRGQRCQVLGSITMDTAMLDVTDLRGVRSGEPVTLLGAQGRGRIGLHEMARWSGVLPYEVICGVSKRVPRRYGVRR